MAWGLFVRCNNFDANFFIRLSLGLNQDPWIAVIYIDGNFTVGGAQILAAGKRKATFKANFRELVIFPAKWKLVSSFPPLF